MIKNMALLFLMVFVPDVLAVQYQIDTEDSHAFIQFRIKHLGYSWLYGRFNKFEGSFEYDENRPSASSVAVTIAMDSIDTNHVERDRHLCDQRFFDVSTFPTAAFKSKSFEAGRLLGVLTLKGISKDIVIDVQKVGGGSDPWGGVRQGFTGRTAIKLKDFGIVYDLGPASTEAEIILDIEGVKR